jgi:hypothetical protein
MNAVQRRMAVCKSRGSVGELTIITNPSSDGKLKLPSFRSFHSLFFIQFVFLPKPFASYLSFSAGQTPSLP